MRASTSPTLPLESRSSPTRRRAGILRRGASSPSSAGSGSRCRRQHGGAGLGFVEQAILLEELGYVLYPGPYLATVALALPALEPDEQAAVAAAGRAGRRDRRASCRSSSASTGSSRRTEPPRPIGETLDSIDPTRPLGRLNDGEREPLPAPVDLSHALTALAAEALGVARRALELAVELRARARCSSGSADRRPTRPSPIRSRTRSARSSSRAR